MQDTIVGKTILAVRPMSEEEKQREGWESRYHIPVLELDGGTLLYPSRDSEGNGPGEFFGRDNGESFILLAK